MSKLIKRKCGCGVPILAMTRNAVPRGLDDAPLTSLGELDAHLQELKTWWIVGANTYRRTADMIKRSPTGLGGTIHRDHRCAARKPSGAAVKPPPPPLPLEPPF